MNFPRFPPFHAGSLVGRFLLLYDSSSPDAVGALKLPASRKVTGNTTAVAEDGFIFVDATAGNVTITLPAATTGDPIGVKKTDSSGNTVTVQRIGSDKIDGANTKVLSTQYESYLFVPDGTAMWGIF